MKKNATFLYNQIIQRNLQKIKVKYFDDTEKIVTNKITRANYPCLTKNHFFGVENDYYYTSSLAFPAAQIQEIIEQEQ